MHKTLNNFVVTLNWEGQISMNAMMIHVTQMGYATILWVLIIVHVPMVILAMAGEMVAVVFKCRGHGTKWL